MEPRILSRTFVLLAAATAAFFVGFSTLIPVLPRFLVAAGNSPPQVGLLLGVFSVTALVLRPVVGREVDRRGRRPFILAGLAFSAVASLGYTLTEDYWPLVALRLLHGAAIACYYPAASALAADLAPPRRRAEVMSYFSMFLYAGLAIGPVIGETIAPLHATTVPTDYFLWAFVAAAALSALGILAAFGIRDEPLPHLEDAPRVPLLNRAAGFPAAVLCLAAVAWAATAFIPLYVEEGEGDTRIFFFVLAITVIVLRVFVGRLADAYGRGAIIVPGTILAGVGLLFLTATPSSRLLALTAIVFGIGWGALFPGLMAMTVDRVGPRERGSALGTFTAAFDLSFGGGQALLGSIWGAAGFRVVFAVSAGFCFAACALYLAGHRRSAARYPLVG